MQVKVPASVSEEATGDAANAESTEPSAEKRPVEADHDEDGQEKTRLPRKRLQRMRLERTQLAWNILTRERLERSSPRMLRTQVQFYDLISWHELPGVL